ncbi:putative reticulocyte-binding protein 2 like protein a [Cadophora sp. MPI-SDFR-AT-0126]|nr:putative reticulocyte-binding protein 2 like protein a [Leotiomycetes sp. MPI-SDFR-AT-0126]
MGKIPNLQPNVNSFAAGFASALILVVVGSALAPAVQAWWNSVKGAGGAGMIMLMLAVGVGAWALGRIQTDGGPGPGGGGTSGSSPNSGPHPNAHSSSHSNGYAGPPPSTGPMPGAGPMPGGPKPSSWQRPPPGATGAAGASSPGGSGPNANPNGSAGAGGAARSAWEKAREETKKKQEENRAREAEKKRKEELEKRLREAREKEAREREAREAKKREEDARQARQKAEEDAREAKKKADEAQERDRKRREEEALEKKRRDLETLEKRLKEAREREARERLAREQKKKDDEEASKPRGSTYAFSAVGEKTNPWPRGRPITPEPPRPTPPSPTKRPPPPTARTYRDAEEDTHSYRPYDKPKKPMQHKKSLSSLYSESSYAASHSTSRTTPPPSHRGPYSTKDPDKIVIKAVYSFNNAFLRTPTSQLVSGVGPVTDGLILRITTEGLFIDDDVRGVPQREWDVKAWTMKLVEVWCPSFRQDPAGNSASARAASNGSPQKHSNFRRLWGLDKEKPASSEETDALLVEMLQLCKNNCRLRSNSSASSAYSASSYDSRSSASDSAYGSSVGSSSPSRDNLRTDNRGHQTGELKTARLHVLRASIRDQEGKKYVFVVPEEESWKVAIGLQRLRKGTQVRALGVSGMSAGDARSTLENLGWGN